MTRIEQINFKLNYTQYYVNIDLVVISMNKIKKHERRRRFDISVPHYSSCAA